MGVWKLLFPLIVILGATVSKRVLAEEEYIFKGDSTLSKSHNESLVRLAKFLGNKKNCSMASIQIPTDPGKNGMFSATGGYNKVKCIASLTQNQGTISERSGCALAIFDVSTARYVKNLVMVDKNCHEGGFGLLLKKKAACVTGFAKDSLADCFFDTPSNTWKAILLYTEHEQLTNWFKKEYADYRKPKATPKKEVSMLEQSIIDDDQRNVCVGWLVEQKFPANSWQYKSSGLKNALKTYKEKYGQGDITKIVAEVCKSHVKNQVCGEHSHGKVHNEGVIPGYFIYGYPDLNVLFSKYKNSFEVATQLCGKKKDFHYPSTNKMGGYETSTK